MLKSMLVLKYYNNALLYLEQQSVKDTGEARTKMSTVWHPTDYCDKIVILLHFFSVLISS